MSKYVLIAAWVALGQAPGMGGPRAVTFDARTVAGPVVSITANEVVVAGKGAPRTLARRDVAEVVLNDSRPPTDVMSQTGRTVVFTSAGDIIPAGALTLADDRLALTNDTLGKVTMPVGAVEAVYLARSRRGAKAIRQRCRKMKIAAGARDLLVVAKDGDNWLVVPGVLKSIGAREITFRWKNEDRTVLRKVVPAIYMAATGAKSAARGGTLTGLDGTKVGFSALRLAGKVVTADIPDVGERNIPTDAVSLLRFDCDRVTDLASLKPAGVKEHGFLDKTFHYKVNSAVGGGPIRLGGKTYETGLGLHSFCELSYDLGGGYAKLVAVVGIDDSVRPAGDASLTFLADGKELDKPLRLTGNDEPQTVRLNVAGVKRLTVRVSFGPDGLDVADHVNIAAPRLIK